MARDESQGKNAPPINKGGVPGAKTMGDTDSMPQGDEIIDLTDLIAEEAGLQAKGTNGSAAALAGEDAIGESEPTISRAESERLAPNDAPDAVSLSSMGEVASSQNSAKYDDEVLEITAADLLDDEALSLAVEETIEALDLKGSEAFASTTLTETESPDTAIDVNDTLDDAFIQSLNRDHIQNEATTQMADQDRSQPQGDELDRLLEEMAGEITEGGLNPEKTIVLEDVVQEPNWDTPGGAPQGPVSETPTIDDLEAALMDESDPLPSTLGLEDLDPAERPQGTDQDRMDAGKALTLTDLDPNKDVPLRSSPIAEIADMDGGLPDPGLSRLSNDQIESALEGVITKLYADKINGILDQVIVRTVNREISRLKEILQEESNDS